MKTKTCPKCNRSTVLDDCFCVEPIVKNTPHKDKCDNI